VRPAELAERVEIIDVLRGWALFGIILADISVTFRQQLPADHLSRLLHSSLVVNKFWPLFSFLFGLGFALSVARFERRGAPVWPLYTRRLGVLLLFGLVNKVFFVQIWRGDILHAYAILGVALLLIDRCSPRTLLVIALALFALPPFYQAAVASRTLLLLTNPLSASAAAQELVQRQEAEKAWHAREAEVRAQSNFWKSAAFTLERGFLSPRVFERISWWVGGIFPMFLLGLYAGRRSIFETLRSQLPFVRKILWWGLALGLLGISIGYSFPEPASSPAATFVSKFLSGFLHAVGNPALSLAYAAGLVMLSLRVFWRTQLARLAPAGRMALSNYLMQSLILAVICPPYGFGLAGTLAPAWGLALAVVIFVSQMLLSAWWLKRFRFGPVEWLWRSLTYKRLQPMRVIPAPRSEEKLRVARVTRKPKSSYKLGASGPPGKILKNE
jgi:uncharacterized protein